MKAFFKVLAISLFVVFGGIFTIVGCQSSPASKVKGSISESEITVYFDEVDGDTVKNFNVALSGIGKMSNKIVFNFENTEIANISLVKTEGNTLTFAVTAKNGGSTNVAVVHQDTNKTIGNIKINSVRKLQSLTLKENIAPHVVVNEETYLRAIDLVSLNPYNTTQTAIGFRLKDQSQNATISLDGKLLVTRKPTAGYITVLAYSLNNAEVSSVEINVEVVEKPVLENLTVYNLNNDAEKVFNQGKPYPIVLVGNYPSKSSISLRAQYFGDTGVDIVFEKAENSNLDIIKLNSNEYEILSNSAENTSFSVRVVNQKYSDVYSEVTIPVKVIDAPTKVFVNGQSEDSTLNVYSSYIGSKGLKLRVGVDIVDMTTSASNEIKLAVGQNRNSFKFFYEDGQTEIDIDNAVLPNNSIIYVLADDQAINNGNNTAVLRVEAYRGYEAGLSVVNNVTLIGRKGANEIALNIPNNQEEIYVKNGNTATIAYSLNAGAYAENITVESNDSTIADFSVDTYAKTISITGKKQGLVYITLSTENGVTSNVIPVRVYEPLEKEQVLIKVESAEQNLYLSEINYNLDNSLERLVIVAKHGTYINLTSNSNGTILSYEFTSNNSAVTINSMGYMFASAVSDETTVTVNYKTLRFTANDGTAEVVDGSKTFTVVSYTALKNLDIVNENNQSIYNVSLISNDIYLDLTHYNGGDYAYNLKLNINPTNAPYDEDGIKWEITENDYIKLVQDPTNPFAVTVYSENYNNYSASFSATVYATVHQFGKTYTRACVITTKSQNPVTMVNISSNEVYFDFSNGSADSQKITVSVNKDALNKKIEILNNYSHIVESETKKNEDNSYTITLTPKSAGVAILNLNVDGLNLVDGFNKLKGLNTQIKVVVADGITEETALYVNDQKDFITMLENQSQTDATFRYYKLNNDIVLMQDLTQYSTFNGSLSSIEGKHYSIRNINVKNGNTNVALFENLNGAVISDIDFYFNDISTNENTFACLANSATIVNLNEVGVFVNNINIDVQNNNKYNVAGVIATIEDPKLNVVKFSGNININSATKITLNELYVGQISAKVGTTSSNLKYIYSNNSNFSNESASEDVKGNIFVSDNILATNSAIGGIVGRADNTQIAYYHVNVNINAQTINNVGEVAGCAENSTISQNLTGGFVKGNDNVGGLIGQLINSNVTENIVEFRLSNLVSIDQNNEFVYVGAKTNVGGLIGLVNNTSDDSTIEISQNYVTAYFDYASVKGTTSVGGFIGNILGNTVLISQSYAKTLVSANEGNANVGAFGGNLDNANIENSFFIGKNKANNNFVGAINNVQIKTSYAIVNTENNTSLYLYNDNGEKVEKINSQNISLSDFVNAGTFEGVGFTISSETINDETIWYISDKYNNNYPILVIKGIVAEKNVSIEKLEDALNNFNNLQDDKFISKGTLSSLNSYYVIGNNQDYNLNELFKLEGIDLDFSLIENETSNILDKTSNSPILKLSKEGVLKLRLFVKQNTSVYKDVFIVSINDFSNVSFTDNENSQSNLEKNILAINKGQSKNLIAKIGDSKIALIAYENQDYSNFTISGLSKSKVIGVSNNLFVSSTNINTVNAVSEINNCIVKSYVVVSINGEYVNLQELTESSNVKVSINSIATDMTVSVTDISMTMLDEFNFEVVVNNTSNESDEVVISAQENELKFNDNNKGIKIISINGDYSDNALLILEKVSAEKNATNSSVTYKYYLRINDLYLNPDNIISFDAFTLNLKFSSKSNNNLSKTISISLSMQDLLHTSFEYYPKAIRTVEDNVTSYILLENGSNKIMPGETGILTIDMYPTYSNFDEIYITAVAESGASIVLSQKALLTQTNNNVTTQNFVSVKPNTALVENGLYLRKLSTVTTADPNQQTDYNFSYNGTLYVMLYVPKTTNANIKYTFNVTTYRLNADGSINEESKQVSKSFYLYTGLVPSITVDEEPLGKEVVVKKANGEFATYSPLVIGVDKVLNINTTNFVGTPKVNAVSGLSVYVADGKLHLSAPQNTKAGTIFTVIVTISQNVEGVLIEDSYTLNLIALDFYIKDIFVSTESDAKTFDQTLTVQYTLESNLYIGYDVDIDQSNDEAVNKFNNTLENILKQTQDDKQFLKVLTDFQQIITLTQQDNLLDGYIIKPNQAGNIKSALTSQLYYYYELSEDGESFTFEITNTSGQANEITHEYDVNSVISTSVDEALAISSAEEFMNMQEGVNYILANNIDLTDDLYNNAIDFNASSLNGNFYTVTINTLTADENGNVGFFKTIKEGSFIKNLTLNIKQENLEINANSLNQINVGLFAIENNGAIYNCKINNAINISVLYGENEEIQYPNQQIDIAGFVTTNSSTGFITNSSVSNITIETKLKANIAGFVVNNDGKVAKNKVTDLIVSSYDDESVVAGFVVNNTNNAQILQSFVDNNYSNDTNSQDKCLLGYGIVSGFVYKNDGLVQSCYTDLTTATNYRSAGFVFDNTGKVTQCNALASVVLLQNNMVTKVENQGSGFSKANTPFTGTNENNEVNNTGSIEFCYYKSNEQDLETYKDILFDEPASYIVNDSYNQETFKGFDIGNSNRSYKTWYWENNKPMLVINEIGTSQASVIAGIVQKVNEKNIGKDISTPVAIYSAEKFLNVLTDALYFEEDEKQVVTVTVNMQLVCDIDMEEVANNEALAKIQSKTFVGSIDGNGFTIKNLSILTSNTSVSNANYFGFFQKVGEKNKNVSNISNLTINVKEMSSSNAQKVGVLAGEISNVHISNVNLDGEGIVVSGRNSVGALVGYASITNNDDDSIIDLFNISSNISVSAGFDSQNKFFDSSDIDYVSYAGGIIGILDSNIKNLDDQTTLASVSNILVYGKVNITADFAGGIFGYNNAYVYNLKFEVEETKDSQFIKGNNCAGGIIAHNGENSIAKAIRVEVNDLIASNYDKTDYENNNKVDTLFSNTDANVGTTYLGGLIGYNKGTVKVGYNKANVVNTNCSIVGGLIGFNASTSLVTELYLTSKVVGASNGNVGAFGQVEATSSESSNITKIVNLSTNKIKCFGVVNNGNYAVNEGLLNKIYSWSDSNSQYSSRELMKRDSKVVFPFYGQESSTENAVFNWKQINTKISYYPQIQLTATSNIITIENETQFKDYIASGNDTYGKTYIIKNDIELENSYKINSFKGTLRSDTNNHYTLHFKNQKTVLFMNLELAFIENVNFKFTLASDFEGNSILADSIKSSKISDSIVTFTNDTINLTTKNETTNSLTTGRSGLIACSLTNSNVSGLGVILTNNSNINIYSTDDNNVFDLRVGALFGETGGETTLKVGIDVESNDVNNSLALNVITNIKVLNSAYIGGIVGYAFNTKVYESIVEDIEIHIKKYEGEGLVTEDKTTSGEQELNVGGFAGYIQSQSIIKAIVGAKIFVESIHANINNAHVGGFAGQISAADLQNVSVILYNIQITDNLVSVKTGGFAGQLLGGKYSLVSVKIVDGDITTSYFGGFAGLDDNQGKNITLCGVEIFKLDITATSNANIAGFMAYLQNSSIDKCFASVNIKMDNYAGKIGGFVASIILLDGDNYSTKISNCYVVGKIVNYECNICGGFYSYLGSSKVEITNSYTALTIINGLKSNAFYGFGHGNNVSNCYYVYNNVGAEHNNVAIPVDLNGLKSKFSTNDSTKNIFDTTGVYPQIIYNNSTLEEEFYSIGEDGTALNPIKIDNQSTTELNIENDKYYILNGDCSKVTLNIGSAQNYVIYGYNAIVQTISGDVAENCYISGITLNVNANKKYGFVSTNDGNIFNCFVNGTLINSSEMSGFVTTNNGTISHSGDNVTFNMNNSLPNVYGFAKTNSGIIFTSYVVGNAQNYKMKTGSTDIASGDNVIVGFVDEIKRNADENVYKITNCYTILTTLSYNKSYSFCRDWVKKSLLDYARNPYLENCYYQAINNINISSIRNLTENQNGNSEIKIWNSNSQFNYGYPYLIDYGSSQIEASSMNSLVDTGNGTEENPYQINNDVIMYYYLSNNLANNNYKLTQNISMSRINKTNTFSLGKVYKRFTSGFTFDGQNYVIYNTDRPLFSYINTIKSNQTIKVTNLGVNGEISATSGFTNNNLRIGGLFSEITNADKVNANVDVTIKNCYTNVNISLTPTSTPSDTASVYVGSLAGYVLEKATMKVGNYFSLGDITVNNINSISVGGFIGQFMPLSSKFETNENEQNYSLSSIKIGGNSIFKNHNVFAIDGTEKLSSKAIYNAEMSLVNGADFGSSKTDASFNLQILLLKPLTDITINGLEISKLEYLLKNFKDNQFAITLSKIDMIGSKLSPKVLDSNNDVKSFLQSKEQTHAYARYFSTIDTAINNKFIFTLPDVNFDRLNRIDSYLYRNVSANTYYNLTIQYGNEWEYEVKSLTADVYSWKSVTITDYTELTSSNSYTVNSRIEQFTGNIRKVKEFTTYEPTTKSSNIFNVANSVFVNLNVTNGVFSNLSITNSYLKNITVKTDTNNSSKSYTYAQKISNSVMLNCTSDMTLNGTFNFNGFADKIQNVLWDSCSSNVTVSSSVALANVYGYAYEADSAENTNTEGKVLFKNCASNITFSGIRTKTNNVIGYVGTNTKSTLNFEKCSTTFDLQGYINVADENIDETCISGFVKNANNDVSSTNCSLSGNIIMYSPVATDSINVDFKVITFGGMIANVTSSNKDVNINIDDFTITKSQYTLLADTVNYGALIGTINATNKVEVAITEEKKYGTGNPYEHTVTVASEKANVGKYIGIAKNATIRFELGYSAIDYNFISTLQIQKTVLHLAQNGYINVGGFIGALDNVIFNIEGIGNNMNLKFGAEINLFVAPNNNDDAQRIINIGQCVGYAYGNSTVNINVTKRNNTQRINLNKITVDMGNVSAYDVRPSVNIGGLFGLLNNSSATINSELYDVNVLFDENTINVKATYGTYSINGLLGTMESGTFITNKKLYLINNSGGNCISITTTGSPTLRRGIVGDRDTQTHVFGYRDNSSVISGSIYNFDGSLGSK